MKNNFNNYKPVSDNEGRLISPGSFHGDEDTEAEAILRSATTDPEIFRNARITDENSQTPYYSDDLINQYNFFRRNIYEPKRVFYPCCNLDISPIKAFPNSEVVLMDKYREIPLEEIMKREGITQFQFGDVLKYKPQAPFDLVIILNPTLHSRDLTRNLEQGGYVIANNYHRNVSQLLKDRNFEGLGTIVGEDKLELAPNFDAFRKSPDYFGVFRKTRGGR
jgi:hypothetical protein